MCITSGKYYEARGGFFFEKPMNMVHLYFEQFNNKFILSFYRFQNNRPAGGSLNFGVQGSFSFCLALPPALTMGSIKRAPDVCIRSYLNGIHKENNVNIILIC